MEAFEAGEGRILVVGRLEDTRRGESLTPIGGERPAGIQHDMTVELEVDLSDFNITTARAFMSHIAHPGCDEANRGVETLVGMKIAVGFTAAVKRRLGGTRGCAHMTSLILTMAPVVVQAAGSYVGRQPSSARATMGNSYLVNSCHMWREDGSLARELREATQEDPST